MPEDLVSTDEQLSKRFISLDPSGYFLIRVDSSAGELVVERYSNNVDELGRATDPETGEVFACRGLSRTPVCVYRGHSAKQLGIQLTEGEEPHPLSRLDHAMYLGRELQRAEMCLLNGQVYVQD